MQILEHTVYGNKLVIKHPTSFAINCFGVIFSSIHQSLKLLPKQIIEFLINKPISRIQTIRVLEYSIDSEILGAIHKWCHNFDWANESKKWTFSMTNMGGGFKKPCVTSFMNGPLEYKLKPSSSHYIRDNRSLLLWTLFSSVLSLIQRKYSKTYISYRAYKDLQFCFGLLTFFSSWFIDSISVSIVVLPKKFSG